MGLKCTAIKLLLIWIYYRSIHLAVNMYICLYAVCCVSKMYSYMSIKMAIYVYTASTIWQDALAWLSHIYLLATGTHKFLPIYVCIECDMHFSDIPHPAPLTALTPSCICTACTAPGPPVPGTLCSKSGGPRKGHWYGERWTDLGGTWGTQHRGSFSLLSTETGGGGAIEGTDTM